METIQALRHETIRRAVLKRPEAIPSVTCDLWERLGSELISIIGDSGFHSLYSRSVYLTAAEFPWVMLNHPSPRTGYRFEGLKMSLEARDFTEASESSIALLITFIDILALLIGESLTTSIMCSAWGDDALYSATKEFRK